MTITICLFATSSCKPKQSSTQLEDDRPFTVSQGNGSIRPRKEICEEQPGFVWKNERCFNPQIIESQKNKCREEKNIWHENSFRCITREQARKQACTDMTPQGEWIDGRCYKEDMSRPKNCPDDPTKVWNGSLCVDLNEPKTFYRYCFAERIPANISKLITFLKNNINQTDCDLAFNELKSRDNLDLSFAKISSLEGLRGFDHFKDINLRANKLDDYTFLENFKNLQTLDLSTNQLENIDFLEKLTNLKSLNLQDNPLHDITALANLVQLESLNLNSTKITDLTPIKNLENLKEIQLDLTPIKSALFSNTQTICPLDGSSSVIKNFCQNKMN